MLLQESSLGRLKGTLVHNKMLSTVQPPTTAGRDDMSPQSTRWTPLAQNSDSLLMNLFGHCDFSATEPEPAQLFLLFYTCMYFMYFWSRPLIVSAVMGETVVGTETTLQVTRGAAAPLVAMGKSTCVDRYIVDSCFFWTWPALFTAREQTFKHRRFTTI